VDCSILRQWERQTATPRPGSLGPHRETLLFIVLGNAATDSGPNPEKVVAELKAKVSRGHVPSMRGIYKASR